MVNYPIRGATRHNLVRARERTRDSFQRGACGDYAPRAATATKRDIDSIAFCRVRSAGCGLINPVDQEEQPRAVSGELCRD